MSDNKTNINWFPGHMAKTRRLIAENLKLVDCVIEIVDARLPLSSRNPLLAELIGQKPSVIVLNKSDLADDNITAEWIRYFEEHKIRAFAINGRDGKIFSQLHSAVLKAVEEKLARRQERGMVGRAVRAMITGIPNVGKSTIINNLSGRKSTKTGDRPGVTTGKQWIKIRNDFEILDTPGILWNKFEDEAVALRLAYSGAIKDDVLDLEDIACRLLDYLKSNYNDALKKRYNLSDTEDKTGYEILQDIARARNFIISRGEVNTERAAIVVLDEFRGAKLGKISLESPEF